MIGQIYSCYFIDVKLNAVKKILPDAFVLFVNKTSSFTPQGKKANEPFCDVTKLTFYQPSTERSGMTPA